MSAVRISAEPATGRGRRRQATGGASPVWPSGSFSDSLVGGVGRGSHRSTGECLQQELEFWRCWGGKKGGGGLFKLGGRAPGGVCNKGRNRLQPCGTARVFLSGGITSTFRQEQGLGGKQQQGLTALRWSKRTEWKSSAACYLLQREGRSWPCWRAEGLRSNRKRPAWVWLLYVGEGNGYVYFNMWIFKCTWVWRTAFSTSCSFPRVAHIHTTPCSQHHLCASLMPIEEIPPFLSKCYHAYYPLTGWAWTVLVSHPGWMVWDQNIFIQK